MKDLKIETESPLSIAEQIEVLELAKEKLIIMSEFGISNGCCAAIMEVLSYKADSLYYRVMAWGIKSLIPCFTRENAIIFNMGNVTGHIYWWDREISEGGLTKRLAFLDWLIERLKEVGRENTKRTTTE